MKKSFQLIALMAIALLGSCSGDKDKTAAEKVVVEKQKVKLASVTARPVDQIQEYTATVEAEVKNNIAPSCIQRPETGADGCGQPETGEIPSGKPGDRI